MKSYRKELWFNVSARRGFVNITREVEDCLRESGIQEGILLVSAMHITASVFINDDESGLHHDYDVWLEKLAPHEPIGQYWHNRTGEDNADAHMKRQVMGREKDAEALIETCKARNVGTMVIKTVTKGPWGEKQKSATTWYEPFDRMEEIQRAVNFALSYEVTGLCTAGDINVLPMVLKACRDFSPLDDSEREAMIQSGLRFEPLFT
jgi:secondary thiamine-phosphate synthase enzyme